MKAKIGVSWLLDKEKSETDTRSLAYLESVRRAGGDAVYLPLINSEQEAEDLLNNLDGLLMTGGDDIDPALYGEETLYSRGVDPIRDCSDTLLLNAAIRRNMPVLCICRGFQMLNVVCGGSLYQDIIRQYPSETIHRDPMEKVYVSHPIQVDKDSHLYAAIRDTQCYFKGWHHQGIKDLGKDLAVTARAEDGIPESIQHTKADYIYGVQFHPERYTLEEAQDASALFEAFVKRCSR